LGLSPLGKKRENNHQEETTADDSNLIIHVSVR